nr:hypothetical protein [Anaerolineae bacterium]
MRKVKFVSVFVLLALLLSAGPGSGVLAQGPQPPDLPTPTDPIITETSRFEWVTVETESGEKRVLVPVSSIESVQTANVPSPESRERAGNGAKFTITMWRALAWYQGGWPNYNWWAETRGKTSTDVTADKLYVRIEHKWRPTPGSGRWNDTGWNHRTVENTTTTGVVHSGYWLTYAGYEHAARGDHQAKVYGQWYIYNNQWGPQRVIP